MSHNVKLNDTQLTNLQFIERAVNELAKEGGGVAFEKAAPGSKIKMRGAYGSTVDCEAVIRIPGGNWDVGLNWNADAKKYDITVESDMGHHERNHGGLGAAQGDKTIEGAMCSINSQSRMLGRLIQRYNLIRDETTAAKSGYVTRRIPGKDGQMVLEAEVRA